MPIFLACIAAVVVLVIVVAALSDLRDRRSGFDPRVRSRSVREHRREVKEQLHRSRAKRLGWSAQDDGDERRR